MLTRLTRRLETLDRGLYEKGITILPRFAVRVLAHFDSSALHEWYVLRVARDQENNALAKGNVCDEIERVLCQWHALVQIDDVGAYARAE
jgi:hypothetical protein